MNLIWVIPAKGAVIQQSILSERAAVERIRAHTRLRAGTSLGIGDDAALLDLTGRTAVCHDVLVEDVHFRRTPQGLRDVGHKAVAVNLSDLAAMGARPVALVVGITVPPNGLPAGDWDDLYAGMEELAADHGATIAGGDTTTGPVLTLGVTAIGALDGGMPLTRAGAVPGDLLCVTGPLGAAAAGLHLLEGDCDPAVTPHAPALMDAQRRPTPRVVEGRILAGAGARAGMDVSDGLLLDALRLAEESGVAAAIAAEDVPVAPGVAEVAAALEIDPVDLAAGGGEDYELLVCVPADRVEALSAVLPRPLLICGRISAGSGLDLRRAGEPWRPARLGWETA